MAKSNRMDQEGKQAKLPTSAYEIDCTEQIEANTSLAPHQITAPCM